ncbi:unnamed protein product, partial [Brachionus calyciflorus]
MIIKGTINGTAVEILIDTGAQRSIISEKAVKELELKIYPITNVVKPVGGELIESKITTPVEIET